MYDNKTITTINGGRIGLVFAHMPAEVPTWPHKGYDYNRRIETILAILKEAMPKTEFLVRIAHNSNEAEKIADELKSTDIDGFVVYIIGIWTGTPTIIAKSGLPTIIIDDLYGGSGELLCSLAEARRENPRVVGVASSDLNDVTKAINLFNVIRSMKNTKIIDIIYPNRRGITPPARYAEKIKEKFGTEIIVVSPDELNSLYQKADEKEAARQADKWIREAQMVVEPSKEEILRSARLHLAITSLLQKYNANTVTIDCLGLFYENKLPAYPCLSYFQLNNDGFIGVCEADLDSTITQILGSYISGRPGYVSDPVIDTAANQIIYAHCVANNRVFGADSKANPYIIRSHAEDGKGASVQSIMPLGKTITTIKINTLAEAIAIHQGKTVANIDDPKGCRTKLAAETNARAILENWDRKFIFGWHRVSFYGDLKEEIVMISRLLGLEVFEEDKI